LEDFTRIAWVSGEAESIWTERLNRVSKAWKEIEIGSVVADLRKASIQTCGRDELSGLVEKFSSEGVNVIPLGRTGTSPVYSSTPVTPGEDWIHRIVYVRHESGLKFVKAWKEKDNDGLGELLGYPKCCRDFFQRVWVNDECVDTTWGMVDKEHQNIVTLGRTDYFKCCNILLRWIGVRLVPHLPCSFSCMPTVTRAAEYVNYAISKGFEEEIDLIKSMIEWPVEWSALHGIAEIKTPVLKISTRTDATPRRYIVRLNGHGYPQEGARGNSFPFKNVLPFQSHSTVDLHTENGFPTKEALDQAHDPIIKIFSFLEGFKSVLDLGCGNGYLLKQLARRRGDILCFGIDSDVDKINHARGIFPGGTFRTANILQKDIWFDHSDTVLLMPGRILEADGTARGLFLRDLQESTTRALIIYNYGWKADYDLERMYSESGLKDDWVWTRSLSNGSCQVAVLLRGETREHETA